MLDSHIRPLLDHATAGLARRLVKARVTANQLTAIGFVLGLGAALLIALGRPTLAAILFLLGRLLDGLDGPVARETEATDLGGYLDIVFDFIVYAAIPLAFALYNPAANALAAACLLAAIVANGAAFLAFAAIAEKRGLQTASQGNKSMYFLAGLAEGTETIVTYTAMCLFPEAFPYLAAAFAALCVASAIGRISIAIGLLSERGTKI